MSARFMSSESFSVSVGGMKTFSGVEPPMLVLRYSIGVGYHWGGR